MKRKFRMKYGETSMPGARISALRRHLRNLAFNKQDSLCCWCKCPMIRNTKNGAPHSVTLEHLIPAHAGGQDTEENCVAACKQCNEERGGAFTPPFSYGYAPKSAA